jgi:hypothetical protein
MCQPVALRCLPSDDDHSASAVYPLYYDRAPPRFLELEAAE